MRIYDTRIGRFLSEDPLFKSFPWYTPYQFAGNGPIVNIDLDGLEDVSIHTNKDNTSTMIIIYNKDDMGKVRADELKAIEKRIKYTKEGSKDSKKSAQFEGPGKKAEQKLFDKLKVGAIERIRNKKNIEDGSFEVKTQGLIPAPVESKSPKPIEPKSSDDEIQTEESEPEMVKYAVFDIVVERDFVKEFSDLGTDAIKQYTDDMTEAYKKEMGFDEVKFRKITLVDKITEKRASYDSNEGGGEKRAIPVIVEQGTKPKAEK